MANEKLIFSLILLLNFLLCCSIQQVYGGGGAKQVDEEDSQPPLILEDIFPKNKNYDRMRPPKENGQATVVLFHVTVMSLDSIDENSMTFVADIFFGQSWKDHRLQYIWLYNDRTILYMVKLTLLLSCSMSFVFYPHDTQQCALKIESLSHTTTDLQFIWDPKLPLDVSSSIELPQLDLLLNETGDCTQVYSTGNFTCVEVVFTFKRRLGYYLVHTYVPTCLIVIMSWISFFMKPEAVPARVTLGVTSLLTLSTQHANSQKYLPPVSYIKVIMGDLIENRELLVQKSLRKERKSFFKSSSTRRECEEENSTSKNGEQIPMKDLEMDQEAPTNQIPSPTAPLYYKHMAKRERALAIDYFSRILFPLSFAIVNFSYWIFVLFML